MTSQMNLRLDESLIHEFEELAEIQHLDRTSLIKKVLTEGISQERLRYAIQKYITREISIEQAANLAKLSLYEFIAALDRLGIPISTMKLSEYQDLL